MTEALIVLVCISLILGLGNLIGISIVLARLHETEWALREKINITAGQIFKALR